MEEGQEVAAAASLLQSTRRIPGAVMNWGTTTRMIKSMAHVVVPAPPDFGALEVVQGNKAVFEEMLVSIRDFVSYRFIVVGYHQSF